MWHPTIHDLDFAAARLHGRRSRLAEGDRLDRLCGLPDVEALARAIHPELELHFARELQRRLAQDLVLETAGIAGALDGPGAALLKWVAARFQVEDFKVLLRSALRRERPGGLESRLLSLPGDLVLDVQGLAAAETLEQFTERLPPGPPRQSLAHALEIYRESLQPYFLEGALDQGYLAELLGRASRVSRSDRELILAVVRQEVDAFHLLLAARGRFHYSLAPGLLLPLHVAGSGISFKRFQAMLAARDLRTTAGLAVGLAIDRLPGGGGAGESAVAPDIGRLEVLAWKRFLLLSNRAIRRSHMGLAAVFGYAGIRRVEVANLITLSEGLRAGITAERIRLRLIPRAKGADYV